jgi:hypothetical protein
LNLAAEQRKMEVFLQMERDRLFQEERRKEANPDAHPYSGKKENRLVYLIYYIVKLYKTKQCDTV